MAGQKSGSLQMGLDTDQPLDRDLAGYSFETGHRSGWIQIGLDTDRA